MIPLPEKLALEIYDSDANNINDSRYTFVVHPSIALFYIERLYAIGYSLHVSQTSQMKGIIITVKNKKSQTLHISKRAKEMLEPYIVASR
jgi:hypothetical protein